jgi:hypothetical protein
MNVLFEMRRNLIRWNDELHAIKSDLVFRRLMRAAAKAGFNPDQPRDERGRWTSEGGIEVTTYDGFLTGIPTIDNTSVALSHILVGVMETVEYLPEMTPSTYGTAVHAAFGLAVNLAGLPGVGDIEQTFSLEDSDPRYGLPGSVRTDVTLRNIQGDVIAIYDVKTGDTQMSVSRADELRKMTRAAPNTPVFELNIVRGISRKNCPGLFGTASVQALRRSRSGGGRI